ncbi:MAG: hypothetical protein NZ699_03425 [Roseiflexus sp.]|nr:hypothetical protein [Roseiflexus sp.]MCS7288163.1 hypothetical protein [Roseiflexus sp.]MDW8232986.1 hypothetical protein [Roseiflexaceae bacterium]
MNIASNALEVALKLVFDFNFLAGVAPFIVAYLLGVVIEYGVLTLFRRDAIRQSLVATMTRFPCYHLSCCRFSGIRLWRLRYKRCTAGRADDHIRRTRRWSTRPAL